MPGGSEWEVQGYFAGDRAAMRCPRRDGHAVYARFEDQVEGIVNSSTFAAGL